MMLAIANEKIMREVKESLTTAVGCSEVASSWNFNTKATYNVANTIAVVRTKASPKKRGFSLGLGGVPIVTILA